MKDPFEIIAYSLLTFASLILLGQAYILIRGIIEFNF